MCQRQRSRRIRGFTLIELLAVLAIVGLLVGLLLPAVQSAREAARRAQCRNNLRQIGLALHGYHDAWQVLPPAYLTSRPTAAVDLGPGWAWGMLILPFAEQRTLFDAANFDLGFGDVNGDRGLLGLRENRTVRQALVSTYLCPSGGGGEGPLRLGRGSGSVAGAPGQYVASAGWLDSSRRPLEGSGVLSPDSRVSIDAIRDGTSSTLMIGERSRDLADATWSGVFGSHAKPAPLCTKAGWPVESCVGLMFLVMGRTGPSTDLVSGEVPGPASLNRPGSNADGFASLHPGGCEFLLCDGSVRFLQETLDPGVFRALATRSGGEVVGGDQY